MNTEAIERELGAPLKRFRTVKGALLWFVDVKAAKDAHGLSMFGGGVPRSQVSIDSTQRTYGLIAACVVRYDRRVDDPEDPPIFNADRRFAQLADWFRSSREKELSIENAANDEGVSRKAYDKIMRYVARRLRVRLEARGLLLED